jgi:hypothetical protein
LYVLYVYIYFTFVAGPLRVKRPFFTRSTLKKRREKDKTFSFLHARNDIVAFQKEEEEKQGSNSTNDAGKKKLSRGVT